MTDCYYHLMTERRYRLSLSVLNAPAKPMWTLVHMFKTYGFSWLFEIPDHGS